MSEQIEVKTLGELLDRIDAAVNQAQRRIKDERIRLAMMDRLDAPASLSPSFADSFARYIQKLEALLYYYAETTGESRRDLLQALSKTEWSDSRLPEKAFDIHIMQDAVYIILPLLPPRKVFQCYTLDSLPLALSNVKGLPKWKSCHFDFCHVLPPHMRTFAKDNDNYNYKRVIDVVTYAMRLYDDAGTVDFSCRTEFTASLRSGTYIKLTEKVGKLPDFPQPQNLESPPL